jgi:hypothetical protein
MQDLTVFNTALIRLCRWDETLRLLVVMGRDFVSALQPVADCTVPGLKRM